MKKCLLRSYFGAIFLCSTYFSLYSQDLLKQMQMLKNSLKTLKKELKSKESSEIDTVSQQIDQLIDKVERLHQAAALVTNFLVTLEVIPPLPPREEIAQNQEETDEKVEIDNEFSELLKTIDESINTKVLKNILIQKLEEFRKQLPERTAKKEEQLQQEEQPKKELTELEKALAKRKEKIEEQLRAQEQVKVEPEEENRQLPSIPTEQEEKPASTELPGIFHEGKAKSMVQKAVEEAEEEAQRELEEKLAKRREAFKPEEEEEEDEDWGDWNS